MLSSLSGGSDPCYMHPVLLSPDYSLSFMSFCALFFTVALVEYKISKLLLTRTLIFQDLTHTKRHISSQAIVSTHSCPFLSHLLSSPATVSTPSSLSLYLYLTQGLYQPAKQRMDKKTAKG